MREIKFRVIYRNKINGIERLKESDSNIYWEWMAYDMNPDNGFERWHHGVFPHGFEYKRDQFTGLKDKNGKDIYENDILHIPYNRIGNQIVSFNDGEFDCARYDLKSCEVIGNIHENKKLLK